MTYKEKNHITKKPMNNINEVADMVDMNTSKNSSVKKHTNKADDKSLT